MIDVFPAEVHEVGGRTWTKARAFIGDDRMTVWVERDRMPVKVVDVAITEPLINGLDEGRPLEVSTLTQGYLVNRGRGCGCHSSLKALGSTSASA